MSSSAALLAPALSFFPLAQAPDQVSIFSNVDISGYAQDNQIYPLLKGEKGSYASSEHAYTLNQAEIGVRYGEFSLSVFSRYEWYLKFSPDTMALYGASVNGEDLSLGKIYNVDLSVEHLVSDGLKLGWSHDWNDSFSTYLSLSYLQAREVMSGELSGQVQHLFNAIYTGELNLDYVYSDDVLLNRQVSEQHSHFGYSSDIGINWQISDNWFVSLWAQDVVNAIEWRNVPRTRATANTATADVDDDGNISIHPVVTGVEDNTNYTQHLPAKYHSRINYLYGDGGLGVKSVYVDELWLVDLEWSALWSGSWVSNISYNLQSGAIGLKAQWQHFYLGIQSDSLDYQQATQLNLTLGASVTMSL